MLKRDVTPLKGAWVLGLSVWSVVFLLPFFWSKGLGVVSKTFQEGSLRFWMGQNPYDLPAVGDVFHYSPLFAAAYGILAYAPDQLHLILWALLNSLVLFYAINLWIKLDKKTSPWVWLALIACMMELDISQRYHQANALIIGLTLIALYLYKIKKLFLAGLVFALGINIKIIPILFALPLLWPLNRRYLIGLFGGLLIFFLLPAVICGWERNLFLHQAQFSALISDLDHRAMLDIKSTLARHGFSNIANFTKQMIAAVFIVIFCGARFVFKKDFPWGYWITFGTASCLLLSPRTESPTFVLIAPCYLLLMRGSTSLLEKKFTLVSLFIISVVFTAVWDPFFHLQMQNNYLSKVIGTFILWIVSGKALIARLTSEQSQELLPNSSLPA